jgi:hypothetical protein
MTVTVEIPDSVAEAFATGGDVSRAVVEAMALDAYRRKLLGESQMRRILGFATRMEVHQFLKEHGVYLNYGIEDAEHDLAQIRRDEEQIQSGPLTGVCSAE